MHVQTTAACTSSAHFTPRSTPSTHVPFHLLSATHGNCKLQRLSHCGHHHHQPQHSQARQHTCLSLHANLPPAGLSQQQTPQDITYDTPHWPLPKQDDSSVNGSTSLHHQPLQRQPWSHSIGSKHTSTSTIASTPRATPPTAAPLQLSPHLQPSLICATLAPLRSPSSMARPPVQIAAAPRIFRFFSWHEHFQPL